MSRTFSMAQGFKFLIKLSLCLALVGVGQLAYGQNTKGDRPVNNTRQVRETRSKSVKKKERGGTRDIAGRRLRTKDKSSANRANFKYPQPSPYSTRVSKNTERSAKPLGRTFTRSPRETKVRAWKGDVSGHKIRRIEPGKMDAARHNVYPQKGPYQRFVRKREKEKPPTYGRTIRGTKFVKHTPRVEEKAWTGGVDKGPIKNFSVSDKTHKVYSQKGPYVRYYNKKSKVRAGGYSNAGNLAQNANSFSPNSKAGKRKVYPASGTRSYVQRGKKNVYWGKFLRSEKGVTTDPTGAPVRTRNYHSPKMGLASRDSIRLVNPRIDGSAQRERVKYSKSYKQGERGWSGDISGSQLRKSGKRTSNGFLFPKKQLPVSAGFGKQTERQTSQSRSKKGQQASLTPVPSGAPGGLLGRKEKGIRKDKGGGSISRGWNNSGNPIAGKTPGGGLGMGSFSGTVKANNGFSHDGPGDQGKMRRKDIKKPGKNNTDQAGLRKGSVNTGYISKGTGYQGNMKRAKKRGQGDYLRAGQKGYNGIGFSKDGVNYSGNMKRSQAGFGRDGVNYSGNMKRNRAGFGRDGVDYSGNMKRNRAGFSRTGANYAGKMKRNGTGFTTEGAGWSGNMKRGGGFDRQGAGYAGNIRRTTGSGFTTAGANFSGNLKQRRLEKGGGSVSGHVWNNSNRAVTVSKLTPAGLSAGRYKGQQRYVGKIKYFERKGEDFSGTMKASTPGPGDSNPGVRYHGSKKDSRITVLVPQGENFTGYMKRGNGFDRQGAGYAGNMKTKRPEKGGGSRSGTLWNNGGAAIAVRAPGDLRAGRYAGNIKSKRPEKGGGSRSGTLWNNNGTAIAVRAPGDVRAGRYAGNIKSKRPEKGGGSRSGTLWNNNGTAIAVRAPGDVRAGQYSGTIARSRFKRDYVQNPNADKESLKKQAVSKQVYAIGNLRVKARPHDHGYASKTNRDALPSLKPAKSSLKAGDYSHSMKQTWHYKHSPLGDREALKVIGPAKAYGRIGDFQGNMKMHKYGGRNSHPDTQFAHGQRDNVKEERTFLMNVKLTWAKLFRKNDTQPDAVKERTHEPRYDKREKGLWNE